MVSIRNVVFSLLLLFFLFGCKSLPVKQQTDQISLRFLDEFIVAEDIDLDGTRVGGLSGIDRYKERYFLVCDDASNPRYYEASIIIKDGFFEDIKFDKVVSISDSIHYLDLEGIRYDASNNNVLISSEGSINRNMDPVLIAVKNNQIHKKFKLPRYFSAREKLARNNGVFEGLSKSIDETGYWLAMELPLKSDGPEPGLEPTLSPVRISMINKTQLDISEQFTYMLDPVARPAEGKFMVNGLTDLLQYDKDRFFVIERSFSSGWGNLGNTVRIYLADKAQTTNTIGMDVLLGNKYKAAQKTLLLDFEKYRDKLTNSTIDNIEGICFGPILSNGNQTLILVADNNFNSLGKQYNQFILLEILH